MSDSKLPVGVFPLHQSGQPTELINALKPRSRSGHVSVENKGALDDTVIDGIRQQIEHLRNKSTLKDTTTRELVLRELRNCLLLQAHFEQLTIHRTITSSEGAVKNANTKNILKLLTVLGVDSHKEDEETLFSTNTDIDNDNDNENET